MRSSSALPSRCGSTLCEIYHKLNAMSMECCWTLPSGLLLDDGMRSTAKREIRGMFYRFMFSCDHLGLSEELVERTGCMKCFGLDGSPRLAGMLFRVVGIEGSDIWKVVRASIRVNVARARHQAWPLNARQDFADSHNDVALPCCNMTHDLRHCTTIWNYLCCACSCDRADSF